MSTKQNSKKNYRSKLNKHIKKRESFDNKTTYDLFFTGFKKNDNVLTLIFCFSSIISRPSEVKLKTFSANEKSNTV